MKILLFGEYSSFHKNLKDGLVELGHNVIIAADSCGWMNIKPDIDFTSSKPGLLGKLDSHILKPLKNLHHFTNMDVVQFISPTVLHPKILPFVKYYYKHLINNSNKSFCCQQAMTATLQLLLTTN